MTYPHVAYGTPRRLPAVSKLKGRVVVLDIAFAANLGGSSYEKVTAPFIRKLGDRLAMWIDHHDHAMHATFAGDPRFVLASKAQHPACPEMVTPQRVRAAGPVDTVCCHIDFDGLCAAAKWIRGGEEPYLGADADARAIDTRMGEPSPVAATVDRALRARPKDDALRTEIVIFLTEGARDAAALRKLEQAAAGILPLEQEARRLAERYVVHQGVAVCDATERVTAYDKTLLLLLGQQRAPVAVVHDESAVTMAAAFDSGINLLKLLGISGGMPTRVSVSPKQLDEVVEILQARQKDDSDITQ